MRTYIAGPMRSYPLFNFPAFDAAAVRLRALGFDPVSPADLDRAEGFDPRMLPAGWDWSTLPTGFSLKAAIKRDLDALLTCEAYVLLPYWQGSRGATAEKGVLDWLGATRIDLRTGEVWRDVRVSETHGVQNATAPSLAPAEES